ncbi:unnamed protein product [Sphagnum jensenii]|uniref:Uncharacterized protein n=1 Tax=Sphagnum jensenii TaxID=128206 RepID=A0ABP1AM75_9BRYO
MAKNCPSPASLSANPVPASVSVIGYVAKLDFRCSPSVTIASPVASNRLMESSAALFCVASRSSQLILPLSYSSYAYCNFIGLGRDPTSSVGIGIFLGKK